MDLNYIRFILNITFMLGTIAVVILYFAMPNDKPIPLFIVGTIAVVVKFTEFTLRIFQNTQERKKNKK